MLAGLVNAPNRLAPDRNLAGAQAPRRAGAAGDDRGRLRHRGGGAPRHARAPPPRAARQHADRHLFRRLGAHPARCRRQSGIWRPAGRYDAGARPAALGDRGDARRRCRRASGGSGRDADRRPGRGDARRPRLWPLDLQPRHPGPPPAGLDLQVVRLSRRAARRARPRGHDRRQRRSPAATIARAIMAIPIAARSRWPRPSPSRATSPPSGSRGGSGSATSSAPPAISASPRRCARTIPRSRSAPPMSACWR